MASDDDIMSFDEYCFDVLDIADTDICQEPNGINIMKCMKII